MLTFRGLAGRCLAEAQPQVLDLAAYRTALRTTLQPALRCAWADAPADQITRAQIEALRTQRLAEGVKDVTAGRSVHEGSVSVAPLRDRAPVAWQGLLGAG